MLMAFEFDAETCKHTYRRGFLGALLHLATSRHACRSCDAIPFLHHHHSHVITMNLSSGVSVVHLSAFKCYKIGNTHSTSSTLQCLCHALQGLAVAAQVETQELIEQCLSRGLPDANCVACMSQP